MEKTKLEKKLGSAHRWLLSITSIVASTAIASSPVLAGTLANSAAEFRLSNFSHRPQTTSTFADTSGFTTAAPPGGDVRNSARSLAFFPPQTPSALSRSFSLSFGEGRNYSGEVQSEAQVLGTFAIEAGETFSFDFASLLDLETSIQDPKTEAATAAGDITLLLLDNATVLDDFLVVGNLSTPGDTNDFLLSEISDNITLTDNSQTTSFGGNEEFASISIRGSFERSFNSPTNLTLIQGQTNNASVADPPVSVPEASFGLALLALSAASTLKRILKSN
ncbi:hypothetical protein Ple7327_0130 [Pleurocapsa sp. PCC 7327]|uniref:hypothetical protein n=1 Tax=Pleurocapsa sp. PCC 7327 TaxID=118163 RepID=UPI00029FF8DC|nr:hypothetical protein [Pleurocapsa sp. PCC 7327]AFY75614.1 hypothetical protein Ple7327_0130 [Pleurocapsa sp. PCC 7327]